MSQHGNFNSSVINIATLADLQTKVSNGTAVDGLYMLNNGQIYTVANGLTIPAGGGSEPRVVENILSPTLRFLDASVLSGTATKALGRPANQKGVKNGTLALESGSAGRGFASTTITILADTWYALSVQLDNVTGMTTGTNSGVWVNTSGTAVINNSSGDITEQLLAAGGNGRYCIIFRSILGGTIIPRIGVGLASNVASKTMTVSNLQLEVLADSTLMAGEYVYPGYAAAFNTVNPYTMDANKKLVYSAPSKTFHLKKYSNILVVGDSRSDEVANIPDQLKTLLRTNKNGVATWHAKGGWSSANQIGPTVVNDASMTASVSCTFSDAASGTLLARTYSTAGDESISDNLGVPFDTLFICDFGVNDVNTSETTGAATALANITAMCDIAENMGMAVILSDNNPWGAHASANATKIAQTKLLNSNLQRLAAERGYLFVRVYEKLGNSSNIDNLSDGSGTTPNYSQDLLHLNTDGSLLYATETYNIIQANR